MSKFSSTPICTTIAAGRTSPAELTPTSKIGAFGSIWMLRMAVSAMRNGNREWCFSIIVDLLRRLEEQEGFKVTE